MRSPNSQPQRRRSIAGRSRCSRCSPPSGNLGDLPDDEAVRIWQRHAHDMDEPDS
jgi:hypothetical protein